MKKFIPALLWVAAFQIVGAAIGYLTGPEINGWYRGLHKSSLNPPDFVFPIAWILLYVLIALAGWRLWRRRNEPGMRLPWRFFILYVAFNWSWSFVFFSLHMAGLAVIWIELINLLSLALIFSCWKRERLASLLMIPPLLWTCFAAWLNYQIWLLN